MKILAVDDDEYILELLTMVAARSEFRDVTTALSGEAAFSILRSGGTEFDCLLFDINMPGMDGIELCRQVRLLDAYRKTPIIMLTAMTEKDYVDRAFIAGATDYVSKPFDVTEVGARLRIAKELIEARREAGTAVGAIVSSSSSQEVSKGFKLADEVPLDGVKNLVSHFALGNYLKQLSQAGLNGTQIVAIKIDGSEAIYSRASPSEFIFALTETAQAIGEVFKIDGYLLAYAGNGVFLLASQKASLEPSVEAETEIQCLLDERNLEYDDGSPLDIEVSLANPIRPNQSMTQGAWKTFSRATARAESRTERKLKETRPINIRGAAF